MKRLSWSGPGFALLITAFCIVLYPIANAFWTKVRLQQNPNNLSFNLRDISLLLSNFDITTGSNYSNTITTCFKCALAMVTAFSSILGRAGPLECLIVTMIGIFGFEFNRQLITTHVNDSFGTLSVFTFGGFMGLALAFLLRLKEESGEGNSTARNTRNSANMASVARAIIGSLIVFLLFPFLALDLDAYHGINSFNVYIGPLNIVLAMAAALGAAIMTSGLINGYIIARDLVHAPIAGAIIAGSASFFATNVTQSIIAGFFGGVIQTAIQNLIEKKTARNGPILSTISWSLFGVQGLLGGLFATIYSSISKSNLFNFSASSIDKNAIFVLLMTLISAGIGLVVGLLGGLIVRCISSEDYSTLFNDKHYWRNDDGISMGPTNAGI